MTNLTRNPAQDISPAWSPDGNWLAFLSDRPYQQGDPNKYELFVIHISGSRLTRLTDNPDIEWKGPLSWSADSSWITLTGSREDTSSVYLVPVNSLQRGQGGARPLGFSRGSHGPARFSPDSMKLVFPIDEPPLVRLMAFDLANGQFTPLTQAESATQATRSGAGGEFDWTFENEKLLYLAEWPFDPETGTLSDTEEATTSLRITSSVDLINGSSPNDEMEILPGIEVMRGLIGVPGELANAAVYLRDVNGKDCWTISHALAAGGFL